MDDRPLKILLVDDDEDDFVMTRELLSEIEGKRVELDWLSTYDAALDAIGRNSYDVYLLDYRLGEHTGLELLGEAIAKGCKEPIILLTGQGGHDVDVEAMKAGAADYLIKGEINAHLLERSIRYAIERNEAKEQILQIAYYDSLTNLPNRLLLQDRLEQGIALAQRHQRITALLFFDLDNFKRINDTLGHRVGDLLLKEVAERLISTVRKSDSVARLGNDKSDITIARLGGDEFTILLSEINDAQDAARVGRRIIEALSQPFMPEGHEVFITASIGIAVYPQDGSDVETLLKNADTAMYHSKEQGKNHFQFYRRSMNATAFEKLVLENDLRKALERREFLLHYQPQVAFSTGSIIGAEALIRWQHPDIGMISPAKFIPIAEDTGLIISIGEWVLQTACAQNKAWQDAGFPPIQISVNLSSQQFRQQELVRTIFQTLDTTGLDPQYLILEITENIIMENTKETIETFHELIKRGLRLSMDDFGTGYSSLSYLKRFPLYALKIDRSFIKEIIANTDDAAIVRAIIAMAHSLKLRVVGEGVETQQQLKFLFEEQCDDVQGFLLSKPLPADEFEKLLEQERVGRGIGTALCSAITEHEGARSE